jgi:formate dehydrogenase subunit gamma
MTIMREVSVAVDLHSGLEGPLMPILHYLQDQLGYIPPDAEGPIAEALNLSRAEVRGVISFYHDFRSAKRGIHQVRICCAEACQARGARALVKHVQATLGVDFGGTTPDGCISLEKVYCLGNCACGPSVTVDDEMHANTTPERFDSLMLALTEAGRS